MNIPVRQFSLRNQILRYFVGFALFLSLLFSGLNFLNLYTIEDKFFQLRLKEEEAYLLDVFKKKNEWPKPRAEYIQIYKTLNEFPDEIRSTMLDEPERIEVSGNNNRYFHILQIYENGPYLVAEVSSQLLIRSNRKTILWFLGFWTMILTAIAIYLGYRLGNRAIKPVTQLAKEIEHLSPTSLSQSLKHQYPNNEVGQLASALEYSMEQIQTYIEREQHFTRDASHELRTPIAIIKTSLELLKNTRHSMTDNQKQLIAQIDSSCLQMEQMITILLALARQEHPKATKPVRVLPIVEQVIVEKSRLIEDKPVQVNVQVTSNAEKVIHQHDLHILLSNLIGNAFQYTQKGCVTVQFSDGRLTITDTGIGLEDSIKDRITEPLVKGQHSQGFGIGLSLVARLCEHQGLSLEIEKLPEGTKVVIE
ncbi:sensor histidine kinase [Pleionea sediminis]|uniref:sensor histidine kinase n=1 Tax=Pleionea sediminis TaxID=2569479 RepID=UPI00118728DE|nr:HAMP domain-containing sensor histidine kinase [Pleionea sediminis]